jgi:DNA-binding MarR family transcriptional regulator
MNKHAGITAKSISNILPGLMSGVELKFFTKNNITTSQFLTLMTIFHSKKCTAGCLAESLYVTMPTVTGLVDRLTKLKLVRRIPCEEDRRKVFIELTDKGKDIINGFKEIIQRRWTNFLEPLSPSECETFLKLFEKIYEKAEEKRNALKQSS